MTLVQTYVFIDLETTGLPSEELNKTRITELSMVAVKRQHLLDTQPGAVPRVQHKLTLCFSPLRRISCEGTKITGLCNYLLEDEPPFDIQVFNMINTFLSVLTQPVCLIAQNGLNFDYPILKNHLVKLKVNFTADVLCADCYHAFYTILESKKMKTQAVNNHSDVKISTKINKDDKEEQDPVPNGSVISSSLSSKANVDEIDYHTSNISMQTINESTPKVTKYIKLPGRVSKARRQLFPWRDGKKPTDSYKLKDIYERVLNRKAVDAHRAENDCIFALEISVALAKPFVEWVDKNHIKFSDVEPMTIGVPMK